MRLALLLLFAAGCAAEMPLSAQEQPLCIARCAARADGGSGCCAGLAYSDLPADQGYYLTTFGGGTDTGTMSCGGVADGGWWYAADKQRFGCGAVLRITAGGRCAHARVADYGPGTCVEDAACKPVLDASPVVAMQLFGVSRAGWSEHRLVQVQVEPTGVPAGPCTILPDGGIVSQEGGDPEPRPLPRGGCGGLGVALLPVAGVLAWRWRRARRREAGPAKG
jgi:hypothetical protein